MYAKDRVEQQEIQYFSKDFKDVPAYYNKNGVYKICCCKRRRKIENIAYYY